MDAPKWLQDEADILSLLNVVLDRFDELSAAERTNVISVPAERHLPGLARGDDQADQLWEFIRELASLGLLQIRGGKRSVYDPQWRKARLAFALTCEGTLRAWLDRPPALPPMQLWRQAVERHAGLFPVGREVLLAKRIVLPGRSADEILSALASLADIDRAATLRQLSARAFWGNSKVLDERRDLLTALFPRLHIRERPTLVDVFLPEHDDGVLFVENQDNYDAVIEGELASGSRCTVVFSAGFRSAGIRIRNVRGARLHFDGPGIERREAFRRWWFDPAAASPPLYFWGDLDFAGMQILKSLRQRFGEVEAWRPGYEFMLAALTAAGGYRPGTQQVDPLVTGCSYADTILLPAIRAHGYWDQERISD